MGIEGLDGRINELEAKVAAWIAELRSEIRASTHAGKRTVHVHAILDASESMSALESATIEGFNAFVAEQRGEASTNLILSLHTFGAPGQLRAVYEAVPAADFKRLTTADYSAIGRSTALNDAVVSVLRPYLRGERDDADAHVVLVITDGRENSSYARTPQAMDMIEGLQARKNWTFVYIGADPKTWTDASVLGFHSGSTITYAPNTDGVQWVYTTASAGLSNLRGAVASNACLATSDYFAGLRTPGNTNHTTTAPVLGDEDDGVLTHHTITQTVAK